MKELIIGKWVMAKDEKPQIEWVYYLGESNYGRVLEITKRGEFGVLAEDKVAFIQPRAYEFLKDNALKVMPVGGLGALKDAGEKLAKTVKVTAEELTLTDDKGKTDKYHRSKYGPGTKKTNKANEGSKPPFQKIGRGQ